MHAPASEPNPPSGQHSDPVLFASEGPRPAGTSGNDRNWLAWLVAAGVILLLLGAAFLIDGHHRAESGATGPRTNPYASHVVLSNLQMSQANNFAGGQLTYIDGTVSNHGDRTITSLTVQALFANDEGEPPQAEQVPLALIRSREPYVDTEPIRAAPLAPGASADFRLIFDDISPMWNQQIPVLKVLSVETPH